MSIETDIRSASDRLWHHKGYYSIIVTSVETRGGVEWVTYFVEQNCDLTLAQYEDAFIRLNVKGEKLTGEDLIRERHFEDNTLRVMSMSRAKAKFRKKKPAKFTALKVISMDKPPKT